MSAVTADSLVRLWSEKQPNSIFAIRFKEIQQWVSVCLKQCLLTALAVALGALLLYAIKVLVGVDIVEASMVFQPSLVLETLVFFVAIFALGVNWEKTGMKHKKFVTVIGMISFGIYLSHLFVLNKVKILQPNSSDAWVVLLTLPIAIVLVYAVSFGLTELFRRTPLSLALTGRRYVRESSDS